MDQVWKCDFCSVTNTSQEVIAMHEAECSFNPATKRCWTCRHQTTEQWPGEITHGCNAGVPRDDQFEIEEDEADCAKWEAPPNALAQGRPE